MSGLQNIFILVFVSDLDNAIVNTLYSDTQRYSSKGVLSPGLRF